MLCCLSFKINYCICYGTDPCSDAERTCVDFVQKFGSFDVAGSARPKISTKNYSHSIEQSVCCSGGSAEPWTHFGVIFFVASQPDHAAWETLATLSANGRDVFSSSSALAAGRKASI